MRGMVTYADEKMVPVLAFGVSVAVPRLAPLVVSMKETVPVG